MNPTIAAPTLPLVKPGGNFHADYFQSKFDCNRFLAYLRWRGYEVVDCQHDLTAQAEGYDFTANGMRAEFKTDRYISQTQNLAYEVVSNISKATPGACLYSQAELLYVMEAGGNICHAFKLAQLRRWVESFNQTAFKKVYGKTTIPWNGESYESECLLIPLGQVMRVPAIGYRRIDISVGPVALTN